MRGSSRQNEKNATGGLPFLSGGNMNKMTTGRSPPRRVKMGRTRRGGSTHSLLVASIGDQQDREGQVPSHQIEMGRTWWGGGMPLLVTSIGKQQDREGLIPPHHMSWYPSLSPWKWKRHDMEGVSPFSSRRNGNDTGRDIPLRRASCACKGS